VRAKSILEFVAMHILVTAGNTLVLVDRVRCLTNIFTGRTGAAIARCGHLRGHRVTLLTSNPDALPAPDSHTDRWSLRTYRTFDDLRELMATILRSDPPDVLVHSAAVSDYLAEGVYAPDELTQFQTEGGLWQSNGASPPRLVDRAAAKVKSDEPELWLRLVRAPKLIDLVRSEWNFRGIVVKFKLEVGVGDEKLLEVAESSRRHSGADLMVANTLEGSHQYAFLGPLDGSYQRIEKSELPLRLFEELETFRRETEHG
jgi:phosphopantothenoylcysteine synthetase/decarboxylase